MTPKRLAILVALAERSPRTFLELRSATNDTSLYTSNLHEMLRKMRNKRQLRIQECVDNKSQNLYQVTSYGLQCLAEERQMQAWRAKPKPQKMTPAEARLKSKKSWVRFYGPRPAKVA